MFRIFYAKEDYQLCSEFIHHMLHHVQSEHKNMMEFEFNEIEARLDKKVFATVTGLNCGKLPKESKLANLPYDWHRRSIGAD